MVDDNADLRDYIVNLLSAHYEVEVAIDGLAALDAARLHKPTLVLSDVMMPGLDGFGLLKALRADPTLRDIPVILLSARAGEESTIEGLEAGADDYLDHSLRASFSLVFGHTSSSRISAKPWPARKTSPKPRIANSNPLATRSRTTFERP